VALVGSQICDALAYVHARRNRGGGALIHGDVTPRNVLLSADGHVLLSDFGLARFASRGRGGTVRYLAPEVGRGEAHDARADLYALAVVLSEAATGRPMFDRDPEVAARQARTGIMPDLEGCDAELSQLLRRALSPTPAGRPRDAGAMRDAFDALLDREARARTAGRAELIARSAAASDAGDVGASTQLSQLATRDATRLPRARRWVSVVTVAAAIPVFLGGGILVARHRTRPASPPPVLAEVAPPPAAPSPVAAPIRTEAPPPAGKRPDRAHAARTMPAVPASPGGRLDLNATPWARVRIDGQSRGETPLLDLSLASGTHQVELVNEPLGIRRELTLTVQPGEHLRRIVDLNAAP
jgi:serine/threonine-protein kinase